jgi:predicted lipoprotein with Yx(FWY)xxD motif
MAAANDLASSLYWQSQEGAVWEDWFKEPMPPGFQVLASELEGPVFTDAEGRTLYKWPQKDLRNGGTGDRQGGVSNCTDTVLRTSAGLMSPYPPGLVLPELDRRPSCTEAWPPVLAAADAEPVGKWEIIERDDGSRQWTHDGYPLYTSVLDEEKGDVNGGLKLEFGGDAPALRVPVGPRSAVPPGFQVLPTTTGRLLIDDNGDSLYAWEGDEPNKSNCYDECAETWVPALAPAAASPRGAWSVIERSPGRNQWTYRGKPLYTYAPDPRARSLRGSDVDGWSNVFTQRSLPPPQGFTVQDARIGQVLADPQGKTIYVYSCADDALDQLACDHPDSPQAYRMAICGAGDPGRCLETFPYVTAAGDASTASQLWGVMHIDPMTGREAAADAANALAVWAYRGRPVYTFGGDEEPGDANADSYGEFNGRRNGYKAFWLRDDFRDNMFSR